MHMVTSLPNTKEGSTTVEAGTRPTKHRLHVQVLVLLCLCLCVFVVLLGGGGGVEWEQGREYHVCDAALRQDCCCCLIPLPNSPPF